MNRASSAIQAVLFSIAFVAMPADAHNGAVALAGPSDRIQVDGDLADWSAEIPAYPIRLTEYGQTPSSSADFEARFRAAYDAGTNSLYVAVEIEDQSVVVDTTGPLAWNSNDGCEIIVDTGHGASGSTPVQFYVYGDRTSLESYGTGAPARVAWRRGGEAGGNGYHHYEWQVDLKALTQGRFAGRPYMAIGLDVVVSDKDADGSFSWVAWGKSVAKTLGPERVGDVILSESELAIGELSGRVERRDTGIAGRRVRLRSVGHPELQVGVETDAAGNYAVSLPEGTYLVDPSAGPAAGDSATVREGETTVLRQAIPPVQGHQVTAGAGRSVVVGAGVRQEVWHSLSVVDGLADNQVRSILQGRAGYLWLGTGAGLSRFDGRHLVSFDRRDGLVSEEVRCLVQDDNGVIWIGTDGGISRYDGETFTNFTSAEGLISDQIRAMEIDSDGMLWLGTDAGLVRYDGWEFVTFTQADGLPGSQVRSLMADADGRLWMGVWGRGLTRYDGERFTTFTTDDGLADNQVRPVLQARDGTIWVGTEAGLSRYDGREFVSFRVSEKAAYEEIHALHEDRQGRIWVGTWGGGVSRFDGQRFVNYTTLDGVASDVVWAFAEDHEGMLWIGSLGGATRFDEHMTNFTTADGLVHNYTRAIVEDHRGDLWIGSGFGTIGGASRYDGETFTNHTDADGLVHSEVWSLMEDQSTNMWVGTLRGVSRFDGKTFSSLGLSPGQISNRVSDIFEDDDGAVWLASYGGGVVRLDREGRIARFTTEEGLGDNRTVSLVPDGRGGLWITTFGGGVSHFDGTDFTGLRRRDGLASDSVWTALVDGDRIWFGTYEGLSLYEDGRFTNYAAEDGLASNRVRVLIKDDRDHLWIGTDSGISRFDGQIFQTLLRRDGLVNNDVRALYKARDGAIWIGTVAGVSRYRYTDNPPPVVVNDIITDRRHGAVDAVETTTTQDFLAFEFSGISFKTRPDAMGFRYRLLGWDED